MQMAHIAKYNSQAIGHMLSHYNNDRHTREGRENVDPSRIDRNYTLTFREDNLTDREFIDERCSQAQFRETKATIKMVDVCIQVPKDYRGDVDRFFESCASFVAERYGAENIIGCYVHKDEWNKDTHEPVQDHAHISFVPIFHDRERDIDRLCAKEMVDRNDLKTFHRDLEKYLERDHIHAHMLNGSTKQHTEYIRELEHTKEFFMREHQHDRETLDRLDKYLDYQREVERDIDRQVKEENDRYKERSRDREYDRDDRDDRARDDRDRDRE